MHRLAYPVSAQEVAKEALRLSEFTRLTSRHVDQILGSANDDGCERSRPPTTAK